MEIGVSANKARAQHLPVTHASCHCQKLSIETNTENRFRRPLGSKLNLASKTPTTEQTL